MECRFTTPRKEGGEVWCTSCGQTPEQVRDSFKADEECTKNAMEAISARQDRMYRGGEHRSVRSVFPRENQR